LLLTVTDARRLLAPSPLGAEGRTQSAGDPPAAGPELVELEDVSFSYGRQVVLYCITMTIRGGLVTTLRGRNGAGKTTLLRQINGLLRPQGGRVRLLGADTGNMATADLARAVGYLPQHPAAMLFNPSVADDLRFMLHC
jgi:energy-coupling factor transport system ATP-binding protein